MHFPTVLSKCHLSILLLQVPTSFGRAQARATVKQNSFDIPSTRLHSFTSFVRRFRPTRFLVALHLFSNILEAAGIVSVIFFLFVVIVVDAFAFVVRPQQLFVFDGHQETFFKTNTACHGTGRPFAPQLVRAVFWYLK